MRPKNRARLAERVAEAAQTALAVQSHVSAIDVLVGIGWLDPGAVRRWQRGQIGCLEEALQVNPLRPGEAMEPFRSWAAHKGLLASETQYVARTPQRQALRFSIGGDPTKRKRYRVNSKREPLLMSIILTVTAKGQVTLGKEVLEHLGVRPGDRLEIELLPAGRVRARAKPGRPVSTIFGIMKRRGERAVTIEEIKEGSASARAGER